MAKKNEKKIVDAKELTSEELALQLGVSYENLMAMQNNIREIQVEINKRMQKPKE
jgi:hypothetical protein